MAYLKDGKLEQSNNRIDRKNFLFDHTPSGARSSTVIFSLIETAKENGLDPYRYLSWLMSCAAGTDLSLTDYIQPLLPWNAPSKCRAGKAHK